MGLLKLLGLSVFGKSDEHFDVYNYVDDPQDDDCDDYRHEDYCPECHDHYYGNDGCFDSDDDDDYDYDDYDYDSYDD